MSAPRGRTPLFQPLPLCLLLCLLLVPALSRAGCDPGWPECQDLQQGILDRYNQTATPCEPAIDLMVALQSGTFEYRAQVNHLIDTYRATAQRLYAKPRQFTEMEDHYRDIVAKATREGLVVPAGAEVMKSPKDGVWGVSYAAMTFDPVLARKADTYRTEMGTIALRWEDETRAFESWGAKQTTAFNDWLAAYLTRVEALRAAHQADSDRLIAMLDSRRYPHCLGVPWSVRVVSSETAAPLTLQAELRAAGIDSGQAEAAGALVHEAQSRLIRRPGQLPGIQPNLPSPIGVFAPLTAPKAPPVPAEVKLLRDGAAQLKAAAELKKTQIEGEKFMLAADAIQAVKRPLEIGKALAKEILIDPVVLLPAALAKPIGDFLTDLDKPLDQAFADMVGGYTELGYSFTIGMVTDAAKKGWEITSDLAGQGAALTSYLYDLSGDHALAGDLSGLFTDMKEAFGRVKDMEIGGMVEVERPYPGDDASPADYQAYLDSADQELAAVSSARSQVRATSEWVNSHLVENAKKAVEVYLAAAMTEGAVSKIRPKVEGLVESLKSTDYLAELGRKDLERFVTEQKLAKEVMARDKAGQEVPQEAVELAKNLTENGPEAFARQNDLLVEGDAVLKQYLQERVKAAKEPVAAAEVIEFPWDAVETPAPKTKPLEVDGAQVTKYIAEGSFKTTYEHPTDPTKVVQLFKTEDLAEVQRSLARQALSKVRLEEAGVGFPDYKVHQLPDGSYYLIADKISNVAKDVIKEGRFDAEHAQALHAAMKNLNDHGMIATDPNLGNIYFERTAGGVLEAKLLDIDGIVRTQEIINAKGNIVETALWGEFDIARPAEIAKLQEMILEGTGAGGVNPNAAGMLSGLLGTEWYSGISARTGTPSTPTTVGSFADAMTKLNRKTLSEGIAKADAAEASSHIFLENRNKARSEAVVEAARQAEAPAKSIDAGLDLLAREEGVRSEAGKEWSGFEQMDLELFGEPIPLHPPPQLPRDRR